MINRREWVTAILSLGYRIVPITCTPQRGKWLPRRSFGVLFVILLFKSSILAYFLSYYFSKVRHGFCLICSGANDYPVEVLAYFLSYYFSKVRHGFCLICSRPNRSYRAYFLSYYFSKVRHGFCLICSGANDYPGEVLAYFLSYYFSKVHPGENPGENPVNATLY